MVFASAAILTESLTVAVHAFKKPCIYAGFINLNTDGHGWTRIFEQQRHSAAKPQPKKMEDRGSRIEDRR
jgi:hypothetical protein